MTRFVAALGCAAAIGPLALFFGSDASASVEPIHVAYEAIAGCPDRAKFITEIMSRTRKASVAGPSEAGRTFVVTLRAQEGGFVGRLEIQRTGEAATSREVTGPTCPAVTTALALVAALAIDPDSFGPANSADSTAPSESRDVPRRRGPEGSPSAGAATAERSTEHASSGAWRSRIGAEGEGNTALAPSVALGGEVFFEIARRNEDVDESVVRASLDVSALRFALHYARTSTIERAGGAAHFDWVAFGLEGCPFRIRFGRRADALVCAAVDAGALRGQGERIAVPDTTTRPWLSVAPLLRFQWFATPSWFLNTEAALIVPLRRDTFVFEDPTSTFHEVPAVGVAAGFGMGYEFGDRRPNLRP